MHQHLINKVMICCWAKAQHSKLNFRVILFTIHGSFSLSVNRQNLKRDRAYGTLYMSIKLVVGLRNPGAAYALTRHNAGAWLLETWAASEYAPFKTDKKLGGEWARIDAASMHTLLFLPLSFMNLNGASVRAIAQFYGIAPHEILVVHDELDLSPGDIRLKTGGGHGGHNGLRDLIQQLHTPDFHRLRIGIGHPGHKDLVTDYVLSKPSVADKNSIQAAITHGLATMPWILAGNFALAMNHLHTGR